MAMRALLLLNVAIVVSTRDDVSFDFGWRFRQGLHHAPLPRPPPSPPSHDTCAPGTHGAFVNASGVQCQKLSPKKLAIDAAACAKACCADDGCGVWQFATASGQGCWIGTNASGCSKSAGWEGGARDPPTPTPIPPAPTPPGTVPPESTVGFDDSNWTAVSAPHDSLINNTVSKELCPSGCSGHSYIPRYDAWYRKHFKIPKTWDDGSAIWLYFHGTFRETTIYLNGKNISSHISGYTSYSVRLDGAGLKFGDEENVISLLIDPNTGKTGWWYEGGGLYRHVRLIRSSAVHVAQNSVSHYANISAAVDSAGGQASAVTHATATVENSGNASASATATFELLDQREQQISVATARVVVGAGAQHQVRAVLPAATVSLWRIKSPTLYTLKVSVVHVGTRFSDSVNTSVGFRTLKYTSSGGFFMNGAHTKIRGFCDHDNFGSVGMGVPDRIKLFRAQASRSVGGNGRRTSHNAPDPVILDIYDRVGICVMDENRAIANDTEHVQEMKDLVIRDRNHPSVIIWSFCNEAGCEGSAHEDGGPRFQAATKELDLSTRPTLANMFTYNDLLSKTIDVQGFSHKNRELFDAAHAAMPDKPLFASECCSCNTMRGQDVGGKGKQASFNGNCQQGQTNASNGVDWVAGTMVWTLFDYYGEPSNGGWPYVSSTFGAFDLVGFAKGGAYWFRSQWLYSVPDSSSDKSFETGSKHMVHVVEGWDARPAIAYRSENKTFAVPCVDVASDDCKSQPLECKDQLRAQHMTFSGSSDGTPGKITNADGLCADATGCTKAQAAGQGCYPLNFTAPCTEEMQFTQAKPGAGFQSVVNDGFLNVYGQKLGEVGIYKNGHAWNKTAIGQLRAALVPPVCLADNQAQTAGPRSMHVYTDAPFAELFLNGKPLGEQQLVAAIHAQPHGNNSYATWQVPFSRGNVTAVAKMSSGGSSVASHTRVSSGAAAAIVLSVDCPSAATGTGSALFLDGQDTGLVRSTIVDAKGVPVHEANHSITFKIVSGPGMVLGVHSGDPTAHEPSHANSQHSAYHGLVRAMIRVTSTAAFGGTERELLSAIDVHHALSAAHSTSEASAPIVVEASAPGLKPGTVSIATSVDPSDSVLEVARQFGDKPVHFD